MLKNLEPAGFRWLNPPRNHAIDNGVLTLTTDPFTDFWQRTYYGFRNDNAHALLLDVGEAEFSFSVRTAWQPRKMYDQCGVVLYQDAENWVKASVEYENPEYARLGSVVTNLGYSDWATTDIPAGQTMMVYRLSRRGQDFLIENSDDGRDFKQIRILHMHRAIAEARIGVYACSPLESSFQVVFSDFALGECQWETHAAPEAARE